MDYTPLAERWLNKSRRIRPHREHDLNANFSISDLRDVPAFADDVADRVWQAWWRDKGVPRDYIRGRVQENFTSAGVPLGLVAHRDGRFMGTASLIASDMDERPHYTPWVAAVWVEAGDRHLGAGSALVRAAADAAFAQGVNTIYLCASLANSPFYERMGWKRIETAVGGLNIFSRSKHRSGHI